MTDPGLEHELVQHAAALRTLARALVGPDDADDVVQDAALQVLSRPPAEPRGLYALLATIVRQLASKRRRSAGRRLARERSVARSETVAAADSACESREVVEQLLRTLLALPDQPRQVLMQRFFEQRPPAQIAARDGVPVETVKTRLKRALALLRERLDAQGHDRRGDGDWRGALCATFGFGETMMKAGGGAAAATLAGAMLMGPGTKLMLGAVTVVAAARALWSIDLAAPTTPPDAAAVIAAVPAAAALAAESPASVPSDADDRRAVVTPVAPPGGAALPATATQILRGRCVDEASQPVAGAKVSLEETTDVQTTGADGRFEFSLAERPGANLMVQGRGIVPIYGYVLFREQQLDIGDIVLHTGARLRLRVVDSAGTPLAGVDVLLEHKDGEPTFRALRDSRPTDAGGLYAPLVGILPATYRVVVGNEIVTRGAELVVPVGVAAIEHDVVVRRHDEVDRITGIVVDGVGRPVASASVATLGSHRIIATDGEGHFEILRQVEDVPAGVRILWIQKDGYEALHPGSESPLIPWGARDHRIVMRTGAALDVQVVDASGQPVESFAIRAFPKPGSTSTQSSSDLRVRSDGHHENGVARITGLARGPHVVFVQPEDPALAASSLDPIDITDGLTPRLVVRLAPLATRILRLQRHDGTAVAGSVAALVDPVGVPMEPRTSRRSIDDWWSYSGPDNVLELQTATTDERGEVLLRGPAGRLLGLFVNGPGHLPLLMRDVVLTGEPLVVEVQPGGRLVGRARPLEVVRSIRRRAGLPEQGNPPAMLQPGFAVEMLPGFRLQGNDGYASRNAAPAVPDADGTFILDGMAAGTWRLTLTTIDAKTRIRDQGEVATVTLRDGATTELDVDLAAWLPCDLEGTVLCNGAPLANETCMLWVTRGVDARGVEQFANHQVTTDAAGHFAVEVRAGNARLRWQREQFPPWRGLRFAESVELLPGGRVAQTFALATATLNLHLVDATGAPVVGVPLLILDAASGAQWHETSRTDARGRVVHEVEARRFAIEVLPKRLLDDDAQAEIWKAASPGDRDPFRALRVRLGEVAVEGGKAIERTLQLPADWAR